MGKGAAAMAYVALDVLGDILSPPRCAACDEPAARRAVFCRACASTVERADPGCTGAGGIAALVYGGAAARAVARLKYERRPDLARPLGDLLWRAVAPHAGAHADALVIPVPLHAGRLADRGYNQAALVARVVARHLGASCLPLALARTRETPRQTSLDRQARRANVAGAFDVRQRRQIAGQRVLLIDDVQTTGATLGACTQALVEGGALTVSTAVIACALG